MIHRLFPRFGAVIVIGKFKVFATTKNRQYK